MPRLPFILIAEGIYRKRIATYIVVMRYWTTILIRKSTREKLKALKISKRESYDEVINRLIKLVESIESR